MNPYKIDKGIKVPPPSRPTTASTISRATLTMNKLAAGDSFQITEPLDAVKAEKSMRDLNRSERARGTRKVFVSRRTKRGLRIWRTR